ncbi:hypothetical protein HDV05_000120 [Chytridiales sp. JEL 0842]|nr:hypothetical protein HDV05_000120 [Chytridiales sp. JEL 0842]
MSTLAKKNKTPSTCSIHSLPPEILILALAGLDPSDLYVDGDVREWKLGGKRVIQFEPKVGKISEMYVDLEEDRLYAGSLERGMVTISNPTTGKVEKDPVWFTEEQTSTEISALVLDKFRMAAGHVNGRVSLVTNFTSRNYNLKVFAGFHLGPVTKLAWLPNYVGAILSGGTDGQVRLWDVTTASCVRVGTGNTDTVTSLAFDPKTYVLAGTSAGKVHIWEINTSALIHHRGLGSVQQQQHQVAVPPVEVASVKVLAHPSPGGTDIDGGVFEILYDTACFHAVTVTRCSSAVGLKLWNIQSGLETCHFSSEAHKASINCAAWDRPSLGASDRRSSTLVTGDMDGRVCVWEIPESVVMAGRPLDLELAAAAQLPSIQPIRTLNPHIACISALYIDPFKFITSAADGHVKVYDIVTGNMIRHLSIRRGGELNQATTAPNILARPSSCVWGGEWRVIASVGSSVRSWDFKPEPSLGADMYGSAKKSKRKSARSRFNANRERGQAEQNQQQQRPGSGGRGRGVPSPRSFQQELRSEIRATSMELRMEREQEMRAQQQRERVNGSLNGNMGMSEEELINYAMMLSMEEDERRRQYQGVESSQSPPNMSGGLSSSFSTGSFLNNPSAWPPPANASPVPGLGPRRPSDPNLRSYLNVASSPSNTLRPLSAGSLTSTMRSTPLASRNASRQWFDDDWDEEDDWEALTPEERQYVVSPSPGARRSSLTISIGANAPPPLSTSATSASLPIARQQNPNSHPSSSWGAGSSWNSEDDEDRHSQHGSAADLSTSAGRRRYVFGGTTGGSGSGSASGSYGAIAAQGSLGHPNILRSPRLGPGHPSPRLGPSAYHAANSNVGVVVARRPSREDEDEELMYVLELSLMDQ